MKILKVFWCTDTEMDAAGCYVAATAGKARYLMYLEKKDWCDDAEFRDISVARLPALDYLIDKHNINEGCDIGHLLQTDKNGHFVWPPSETKEIP